MNALLTSAAFLIVIAVAIGKSTSSIRRSSKLREGVVENGNDPSPSRMLTGANCENSPNDWVDSSGDDCSWYEIFGCDGARQYTNSGLSALEVCCACKDLASSSSTALGQNGLFQNGLDQAALVQQEQICIEGLIMDFFCIKRGRLLDNPAVETLKGPEKHTLHCLVDVPICVNSGYEVLAQPQIGEDEYCRAYRLNDEGNRKLVELARASGNSRRCSTCTGGEAGPIEGFRATIKGKVADNGDSQTPPTIAVTEVLPSTVGCENQATSPFCTSGAVTSTASTAAVQFTTSHTSLRQTTVPPTTTQKTTNTGIGASAFASAPTQTTTNTGIGANAFAPACPSVFDNSMTLQTDLKLLYSVVKGDELNNKSGILCAQLVYDHKGWISFALSTNRFMAGSEAIIGLPDGTTGTPNPGKYLIQFRAPSGIILMPGERQTLIDASISQTDTMTVMTFGKFLNETNEIEINGRGNNTFLWAVGFDNNLNYHKSRGIIDINLGA